MDKKANAYSLGLRSKLTKPRRRQKQSGLARAVLEYLVSDSYLYAPLLHDFPKQQPAEQQQQRGATPPLREGRVSRTPPPAGYAVNMRASNIGFASSK